MEHKVRGAVRGKGAGSAVQRIISYRMPSFFLRHLGRRHPSRNIDPYIVPSVPMSEGLNVGPEAKHPFQEMEFDSWVGSPLLSNVAYLPEYTFQVSTW